MEFDGRALDNQDKGSGRKVGTLILGTVRAQGLAQSVC